MAKIKWGSIVTDGRGKVGGQVYSKNKFGAYLRNKVTPVNPQTLAQTQARTRFVGFSQGWRGLTSVQRQQWNDATINFPKTNQFGDTVYLTGAQLYQSLNNTLQVTSSSTLTAPPTPASVTAITAATLTAAKGTPAMSLTFAPTPVPASTSYLIYMTNGVSPGVSFVKNLYRLVTVIAAAATSPQALLTAYAAKYGAVPAAGQVVFCRIVPVNTLTGQQGTGFEVSAVVAA